MSYNTPLDGPEESASKSGIPKLEWILIALALIGILFKFSHWPFSGIILILSLGSLSIFYFSQTSLNLKGTSRATARVRFGSMACSIATIGILFKILHWPDADFLLILGSAVLFILIFTGSIMGNHSVFLKKQIILLVLCLLLFWKYNSFFPPLSRPSQASGINVPDTTDSK